uniref:Cytochrome b5 domain-containing protein 1 n=1 Tax=Strigamia maritima TaxID=126957 RepID=T1J0V1_STRMM
MSTKRYFTPNEVLLHNSTSDLWVSFLGKVCNLTKVCQEYKGSDLLKPIKAFAGKDVSMWFNPKSGELKTHIDQDTGLRQPCFPHGRFVHGPPPYPASDWSTDFGLPWWKNKHLLVGNLSKNVKRIRIINVLASVEDTLEVCAEETINDISERYRANFNSHARSYTWKCEGRCLDMNKTMAENGILDDQPRFYRVNLPEDIYLPSLLVFYNDDLTED